jgi:DNA N-6-adenine-methyltransferase (Dam)
MPEVEAVPKTSEWRTPKYVFDPLRDQTGARLVFDQDPCAPDQGISHVPARRIYTKADDGLRQPWRGLVFMNPPYSEARRSIVAWVQRFFEYGNALDAARGVMLARRAYTKLYRDAHEEYREPPAIVHARFELNGEVLATYNWAALAELVVPVDDNPYGGIAPLPLAGTPAVASARPDAPADDGFSRWLKDNPPPDLQRLVDRYGGHSKVPPEAWADFDRAKVSWEVKRKSRLRYQPPAGDALATPDQVPSPESSPFEPCVVCGIEARFGYRNRDRMEWFCAEHRRAQSWADAWRGGARKLLGQLR